MVYFKQEARADLQDIFEALLNWETENKQRIMTYETVIKYHNDILDTCESLDTVTYNRKATYSQHKKHGEYIHQYKRNSRTSWYIIYNKLGQHVYIEKIINNYKTL